MSTTPIEKNGTLARITIQGDLTVAVARELRPQLQQALNEGCTAVVFDLAQAGMVDSSGIGLLIAVHNSLKSKGGTLKVEKVSAEIMQLFKTMRLNRHFPVEAQ